MTEPVIPVPKEMDGRQRFLKEATIVFEVIPAMMQVLVNTIIPSQTLYHMAMANKHFIKRLNKEEQTMLKDLRNGYSKCSFIFLYKLVHMTHVLPDPTSELEGGQSDRTVSMSDIYQLRTFRNEVCHSIEASVTKIRFEHFSQTLLSIAKRIDECCKSAFEKDIVEIMNNSSMDDKAMDKDIKAIREIEEMKCRASIGDTKIYYGKGIEHRLKSLTNTEDMMSVKLVIKLETDDVTDEMLQKINAVTESLQTETLTIKSIEKGSIIFTVSVCWSCIQGEEHFIQEIVLILQQALKIADKKLEDYSTVVVFVDDSTNDSIDIENLVYDRKREPDGSLKRFSLALLDDENAIAGLENTGDFILQGSKITSEEKLFALLKENLSDGSACRVTVLVKMMETANFLKPTASDIESVRNKEVQIDAARSVGIIRGPKSFGTGWRVGEHYVITAWHVVKDNTDSSDNDIADGVQSDIFNIEFHYKEESQLNTTKFKFEKIVFIDDELDTAILKLSHNGTLPPEIKKFRKISTEDKKELCIIGHPAGKPQIVDSKVQIVKLTVQDLQKAQQWSQQNFFNIDGYERINDPRFILYNCYSTQGASGSVGIIIEKGHKEPVAVIMHLSGYPTFAYNGLLPKNEIKGLKENGCIVEVEQGVKLESVFKAMEAKNCELRHEIFGNQFR